MTDGLCNQQPFDLDWELSNTFYMWYLMSSLLNYTSPILWFCDIDLIYENSHNCRMWPTGDLWPARVLLKMGSILQPYCGTVLRLRSVLHTLFLKKFNVHQHILNVCDKTELPLMNTKSTLAKNSNFFILINITSLSSSPQVKSLGIRQNIIVLIPFTWYHLFSLLSPLYHCSTPSIHLIPYFCHSGSTFAHNLPT